jgi:hypothetical protein
MNAFLQITAERRRLAFQQVDASMGLQAFSVEKDFLVCWTLRELFTMNRTGPLVAQQGRSDGAKKNGMTTHDTTAAPQLCAPSTCTLKIHHCLHSRIGPYQQIPGSAG